MSQPGIIFRAFDRCTGFFTFLSPLFDLTVRLWVAQVFFMSGLTKIQSWSGTLGLFKDEYEVPLLPPAVAAVLGTAAELTLPILIAIGLATRLSSLALFLFNLVAVYAYGSFLFSDDGAAGLQQHILWGALLAMLVFHGPGKLSLDHLILRRYR
ncbi:DoxX family protein [Candidatus Thiosymbion oneisti]|uniref:DoxX family protein n=1 Tax=Candidatus Thiosymbion oneisti TaxID=589554 RepID=UPI000B7DEBE3|nr:DoxX family protein [Candidatus Thiosymbion oneisti]